MRSIKEAASVTGISEQNIRYYEKQGLIQPGRNRGNAYREYSDEDINRLKLLRLFRKLDMPIMEIRRRFAGEVTLAKAVEQPIQHVHAEKDKQDEALRICGGIHVPAQ